MRRFPVILVLSLFVGTLAAPVASAKPRSRRAPAATFAPVEVIFRDPVGNKKDAASRIARKVRLEAGAMTASTCGLTEGEASRSRAKYLLRATESVEGGYDAVNIYDRGILSWGIMQWASHSNSLQDTLYYMKGRLRDKNKSRVWKTLFKDRGLDVQRGPDGSAAFFVGSNATGTWRPVTGIDSLRVLFRGTKTIGKYDPATITRWAKVFARAGRQPVIQTLQVEWASRRLFYCLDERVDGPWRVRDFGRGDVFSDALYFALWTNNPNACRKHFRQAVRQARTVTGEADPKNWPPGLFPLLWEHVARSSSFGTWPRRTAQIVEMVPVGRVGRNRAYQELASRGWRLDALRRGAGSGGRLWRREVKPRVPPKPKTARPAAPKAVAPTPPRAVPPRAAPQKAPNSAATIPAQQQQQQPRNENGNGGTGTGSVPANPGGG